MGIYVALLASSKPLLSNKLPLWACLLPPVQKHAAVAAAAAAAAARGRAGWQRGPEKGRQGSQNEGRDKLFDSSWLVSDFGSPCLPPTEAVPVPGRLSVGLSF